MIYSMDVGKIYSLKKNVALLEDCREFEYWDESGKKPVRRMEIIPELLEESINFNILSTCFSMAVESRVYVPCWLQSLFDAGLLS